MKGRIQTKLTTGAILACLFLGSGIRGFAQGATPGNPADADAYGWTRLHHAVRDGDTDVVARLADRRSVGFRDRHRRTPLHIAATWGQVEAARILIDSGADVNVKDEWGATPMRRAELMQQVRGFDRTEFIELLRRHGAGR